MVFQHRTWLSLASCKQFYTNFFKDLVFRAFSEHLLSSVRPIWPRYGVISAKPLDLGYLVVYKDYRILT